jgi:hypothetical protein
MDQDEVNSSDIEPELVINEFAHAGAQSLKRMLQHAVEDRLESKKRSKQLQFVHGSKKTQYINHLWYVQASTLSIVELSASLPPPDTSYPVADSLEVQ